MNMFIFNNSASNSSSKNYKNNITIYKEELEKLLDISVVAVKSRKKIGINDLKEAITKAKISTSIFYDFEKQKQLFPHTDSYQTIIESALNIGETHSDQLKQYELSDNIFRFSKINYIIAKCIKKPEQLNKNLTQILLII